MHHFSPHCEVRLNYPQYKASSRFHCNTKPRLLPSTRLRASPIFARGYRALTLSQHRSSPINNVRRRNASSFTLLLDSFYCEVFERRELPQYVAVTPVAGLFAWFMYRSAARFRFTSGHVVRFCSWLILVPNIESCQLTWRCLLRFVSASARCPRATCTVGSRSACRRLLLRYIFLGFALRITALTTRCNALSDYFSPLVALPTECVCIERCPLRRPPYSLCGASVPSSPSLRPHKGKGYR